MRIIADHIRAIVMIAGDEAGIKPSNTDQGYILRRLIRRMIRYAKKLNIDIILWYCCGCGSTFLYKFYVNWSVKFYKRE